jgi:outer membrane protein OmpA-like peptidoglycan-associated protein/tetratricopeptide (TPR) repeat protein
MKAYQPLMKTLLVLTLVCGSAMLTNEAMAQVKKGERLMNEGKYNDAVKVLRKDFFSKNPNPEAGYPLAQCYYRLNKYDDARDVMELIQDQIDVSTEKAMFYADVLIATEDFSTAYLNILSLMADNTPDPRVYLWFDKVNELLRWDSVKTGSKTTFVTGINTVYNEYAPFVNKDGALWYITDINSMQAIFPASYSGQNIHLIYKTKYDVRTNDISKPSMVVKDRKYYDHDGPMDEWAGKNKYAITMRDIDAPVETSRVGIFFIDLKIGADPIPFKYNQSYNTGHPSFSEDGKRLYFSSDRPGGFGQMDLWYSDWENEEWSLPVNLGPVINSPANEVFPRYFQGRLYFASDRRDKGYGGLDLYYSSEMLAFSYVYNMREPINSAYDDFALTMINYTNGFSTSNRAYGAGGDDVYYLEFIPEQIVHEERLARFKGKEVAPGTPIVIRNGEGEVVKETVVNELNIISLAGLKSRETYAFELKQDETLLSFEILDDQGQPAEMHASTTEGRYRFELLDPLEYSIGREAPGPALMALMFDLKGKIHSDSLTDFRDGRLSIETIDGKVFSEVKTTPEGAFIIKGLKRGEQYTLKTLGIDTYHEIDIYGESGALAQSIKPIGLNSFGYTRAIPIADWMIASEIEEGNVLGAVLSNSATLPAEVLITDMKTGESRSLAADQDGFISFGTLYTLRAYELKILQGTLEGKDRLVMIGASGDTSQTVRPTSAQAFQFEYQSSGEFEEMPSSYTREAAAIASMKGNEAGQTYPVEVTNLEADTLAALKIADAEKGIDAAGQGITFAGKAMDEDSGNQRRSMQISNEAGEVLSEGFTAGDGGFSFRGLPEWTKYIVSFPDAVPASLLVALPNGNGVVEGKKLNDGRFEVDFDAEPLAENDASSAIEEPERREFTVPHVYYNFNSYYLKEESRRSLDMLMRYLRQNPEMDIEIRSYTDCRGSKQYNQLLSERRAKAVKDYLIGKKIDALRLTTRGFGEEVLVNECTDEVNCNEEQHAVNRRTTFVILNE